MAVASSLRRFTSVVLRSFLIVPVVLPFVFFFYDIVLQWKMTMSPHRAGYKAIAAEYLYDASAKFEDDTWVEMIGHSTFFLSFISSLFAGVHLLILIFEAYKGGEFPGVSRIPTI